MVDDESNDADWPDVSRETKELLRQYQRLVLKWNSAVNLVSRNAIDELWRRHIMDSAQIALLAPKAPRLWADLGSGGGFPGIVAAIQLKTSSPDTRFVLIESDARKATFLSQAVREFALNAEVRVQRIEVADSLNADVLTARALAPLGVLLGYAQRHLSAGGRAFFPKGARFADEVREARQGWSFHLTGHISRTDPDSAILEVKNIEKI